MVLNIKNKTSTSTLDFALISIPFRFMNLEFNLDNFKLNHHTNYDY